MDQDNLSKTPPYRVRTQYGQERPYAGSRANQPEAVAIGNLGQNKEAGGARREVDVVARLQCGQVRTERAARHGHAIELVGAALRRIDEGKWASDHFAIQGQAKLDELPSLEIQLIGRGNVHLKGKQRVGPPPAATDAALDPLLTGSGIH